LRLRPAGGLANARSTRPARPAAAGMEGTVAELLQRFAGSREGCFFDSASPKVDALAVCHEVRCPNLAPGERTCVSFRVLGLHEDDVFSEVGETRDLRSLQLDTVVLLRVWASPENLPAAPHAERRACGEARIPLRHLVSRCDGMLYQSWMMLDSPGLSDSVASVGLLGPSQDGEAFAQALLNGPRQLFQPKACVSICKADDLGPSGQVLWTADAAKKERIARWGPLLRSQQQHVVLCTAQHLHGSQVQRDQSAQAEQQVEGLEEQAREQVRELESLRERLRSRQESLRAEGGPGREGRRRTSLWELEAKGARQLEESRELAESCKERAARRGREGEAALEAERQRNLAEQLRQELESLQEELAHIGEEANDKIEAANVCIRKLRRERDEALADVEKRRLASRQLIQERDELSAEKANLANQKEALMKIVEDLHQTCISAGLSMAGTEAINSITGYRFP